jgi:glucose/arabinose dehydrogenase
MVGEPSLSQDKTSLAGKILRVTRDGEPAPGNPFGTRIYSYGHRNPQGIVWDDLGRLWATEHGPSARDELNLIEAGANYGWPETTGTDTRVGIRSPIIQSGQSTWAPAGAEYLDNSIFFAGLRGSALYEYDISANELTVHLEDNFGRIRDVVLGPDGFLYVATSNRDGRGIPTAEDDRILKINPLKLGEI